MTRRPVCILSLNNFIGYQNIYRQNIKRYTVQFQYAHINRLTKKFFFKVSQSLLLQYCYYSLNLYIFKSLWKTHLFKSAQNIFPYSDMHFYFYRIQFYVYDYVVNPIHSRSYSLYFLYKPINNMKEHFHALHWS